MFYCFARVKSIFKSTQRSLRHVLHCDKTLRSFENTREMKKTVARVFYISFVFSNDHRVLSQCNTWLRLLYLSKKDILEMYNYHVTEKCLKQLWKSSEHRQ